MLRQAFSALMILTVCAHTGGEALLYGWYWLSNRSFERVFCINRETPERQCHGQCMLSQLAKQEHDPAQQAPNPVSEEERLRNIYLEPEQLAWVLFLPVVALARQPFRYQPLLSQPLARDIFHPPIGPATSPRLGMQACFAVFSCIFTAFA